MRCASEPHWFKEKKTWIVLYTDLLLEISIIIPSSLYSNLNTLVNILYYRLNLNQLFKPWKFYMFSFISFKSSKANYEFSRLKSLHYGQLWPPWLSQLESCRQLRAGRDSALGSAHTIWRAARTGRAGFPSPGALWYILSLAARHFNYLTAAIWKNWLPIIMATSRHTSIEFKYWLPDASTWAGCNYSYSEMKNPQISPLDFS